MLTSWKQTCTSIEYPLPDKPVSSSAKKKKNSRKSIADESETTSSSSTIANFIGAQFVHQLVTPDQGKSKSLSSRSNKKRRKFNNDTSKSTYTGHASDEPPVLCLTSPHRVVFMDNEGQSATNNATNLIENKSRNYVTRPGSSSRFSLHQTIAGGTSEYGAFAGMVPPGARFDSRSNLIYAIRNGGSEVAIWTAASCSTLPGPDEDASVGKDNSAGVINANKRKPQQGTSHGPGSSLESITSQRLQIPDGKSAVTLTPFNIPAAAAVGAAGCCDDGSIWVAIRIRAADGINNDQFQLLMVDDSSIDKWANGAKSGQRKKRRSTARAKVDEKQVGLVILDSHVTGTGDAVKASVFLKVKSVILSNEKTHEVALCNHEVRINCESGEHTAVLQKDRSVKHNVLQLGAPSGCDIAAKFDANAESASIVHLEDEGRWMFTSVKFASESAGALINSVRTFPVNTDGTAVFSFGMVGQNVAAILTKGQSTGQEKDAYVMSLRMVDVRRKAELSSVCWTEGNEVPISATNDSTLKSVLKGKQCRGMVTNELDGSIALLTTSKEDNGSLGIVSSRFDMSSTVSSHSLLASSSSSLVSALRSAAASAPIYSELRGMSQTKIDDAVDQACKLLESSANELIELAKSRIENGSVTNGKKHGRSNGWKHVYHECCMLIMKAKGSSISGSKNLINGIKKNGASKMENAGELPKLFIETAFKESSKILLLLQRVEASAKGSKEVMETVQEAVCILIEVLQTKQISARANYGLEYLHRENTFSSILKACSSMFVPDVSRNVGTLHIVDAMLENIQDIPEGALVSILRFVLRGVISDDVAVYYAHGSRSSGKGTMLANQYREIKDKEDSARERIGTTLLSEAVLDFAFKIVTYSKCNHSFLTKAMRDSINVRSEVETLLLAFAKLLKRGGSRMTHEGGDESKPNQVSLSSGVLHWISALTDAHMGTLVKITNEGGIVIDRVQRAVRSAMAQSEFANELREFSDIILLGEPGGGLDEKPASTKNSTAAEKTIAPYTIERLAF